MSKTIDCYKKIIKNYNRYYELEGIGVKAETDSLLSLSYSHLSFLYLIDKKLPESLQSADKGLSYPFHAIENKSTRLIALVGMGKLKKAKKEFSQFEGQKDYLKLYVIDYIDKLHSRYFLKGEFNAYKDWLIRQP